MFYYLFPYPVVVDLYNARTPDFISSLSMKFVFIDERYFIRSIFLTNTDPNNNSVEAGISALNYKTLLPVKDRFVTDLVRYFFLLDRR